MKHIPNLITALRLGLLPWFAHSVLVGARGRAFAVLAIIAFSDWLDGWLARRFRIKSRLGAVLDPLADKLVQVTALVLLAADPDPAFTAIPAWFVALVLARDLLLVYGALRIRRSLRRVAIRAQLAGKLSTALVFGILFGALADFGGTFMIVAVLVTVPVVVIAAVQYAQAGRRQLHAAR